MPLRPETSNDSPDVAIRLIRRATSVFLLPKLLHRQRRFRAFLRCACSACRFPTHGDRIDYGAVAHRQKSPSVHSRSGIGPARRFQVKRAGAVVMTSRFEQRQPTKVRWSSRCGRLAIVVVAGALLVSPVRAQDEDDDYKLAVGLYNKQRWDIAAESFQKFLKDNPDHAEGAVCVAVSGHNAAQAAKVRRGPQALCAIRWQVSAEQKRPVCAVSHRRVQLFSRRNERGRERAAKVFRAIPRA